MGCKIKIKEKILKVRNFQFFKIAIIPCEIKDISKDNLYALKALVYNLYKTNLNFFPSSSIDSIHIYDNLGSVLFVGKLGG